MQINIIWHHERIMLSLLVVLYFKSWIRSVYLVLQQRFYRLVERLPVLVVVHRYPRYPWLDYAACARAYGLISASWVCVVCRYFQRFLSILSLVNRHLLVINEGCLFVGWVLFFTQSGILFLFEQLISFSFLSQVVFAVSWLLFP